MEHTQNKIHVNQIIANAITISELVLSEDDLPGHKVNLLNLISDLIDTAKRQLTEVANNGY